MTHDGERRRDGERDGARSAAAVSGRPVRPGWPDPDDDRGARAVWSRLTEPGDAAAGRFVAELGAGSALRALLGGRAPAAQAARWRVRIDTTRPADDLGALARVGGRLLVPGDPEWPEGLDQLGDRRPFCLWVRGGAVLPRGIERSVAIVGARAATGYGERVALDLAAGVADRGITVVSGAAFGIDACAHRGALAAGGATVAVLASGPDRAYPRGNEHLIERIAREGCVISEVPPGCSPTRWRFVQRNRLIAALGQATVVVEAAWRSGAATTVREALELGRLVAAVPGPVTSSQSAGCHKLLRDGATCVTDAAEVVELISAVGEGLTDRPRGPAAEHDGLDPAGIRVLDAVPLRGPGDEAAVAVAAGLDLTTVRACLHRLELRGLVERGRDGWRRRRPPRTRAAAAGTGSGRAGLAPTSVAAPGSPGGP